MTAVVFLVKCGRDNCLVILSPSTATTTTVCWVVMWSTVVNCCEGWIGGKTQASLFFWAKSSVSACSYAVWRSNVLFSSNLCRITSDVIPQIKSLSHSFITDLLSRPVKLQYRRKLSRLWKKSSIDSSCLCFLVVSWWRANASWVFLRVQPV